MTLTEAKMFKNMKDALCAPKRRDRHAAWGKMLISAAAVAFVAAAFSDVVPAVPEEITTLAGGCVGLLIGCAKFSS